MVFLNKMITESTAFRLSKKKILAIYFFPYIITCLFAFMLVYNKARLYALMLLKENSLVENLTFIAFFLSFLYSIKLVRKIKAKTHSKIYKLIIGFMAIVFFFIAMEEIAWGQQFFNFETPENFKKINAQDELTLHNINGLQGESEIFRLAFGLAGLVGLFLNKNRVLSPIAFPFMLSSYLLVIISISVFDVYDDFYPVSSNISIGVQRLSELIEMLIGFTALLYILLLIRKIQPVEKHS
ncbi:hypothetical protein GCM10023311_11910 [Flaviramulus aquimarinus]|uniref:Uncharacterized protein n=2 Tax=Flaviramulus aquimarinus TaxID=1170456 RepID=A0ABP9F489_9FLAO